MCFPVGKKEWYDSLVPGKGISSETPFLFKVTGMPSSYFSVHKNAVFRQRNLWRNQEYCDTAALFTVKPERGKRHAADRQHDQGVYTVGNSEKGGRCRPQAVIEAASGTDEEEGRHLHGKDTVHGPSQSDGDPESAGSGI